MLAIHLLNNSDLTCVSPPKLANCEADEDLTLLQQNTEERENTLSVDDPQEDISENTLSRLDTALEDCAVYYFAGYTAKKCLNKFNCATCASTLKNENSDKIYNCQAL